MNDSAIGVQARARLRFDLQHDTFEQLDPSWVPDVSDELVQLARTHPMARRALARELLDVAPALCGLFFDDSAAPTLDLTQAQSLREYLRAPLDCALDLAAQVLAPRVRTLISRADVTRWRSALGEERYERILAGEREAISQIHLSASNRAMDLADVVDASPEELHTHLTRCGAAELAAYGATIDRAFDESIRLRSPRAWWIPDPVVYLVPEIVEHHLRAVASWSNAHGASPPATAASGRLATPTAATQPVRAST